MIRIQELRNSRRISQQTLADAIGIRQQTLNKYEHELSDIRLKTFIRIADYFHASLDYLAGRTTPLTQDRKFMVCEDNLALCNLHEAHLLHLYRQLPAKYQNALIDFLSLIEEDVQKNNSVRSDSEDTVIY